MENSLPATGGASFFFLWKVKVKKSLRKRRVIMNTLVFNSGETNSALFFHILSIKVHKARGRCRFHAGNIRSVKKKK